MTKHPFQLGGRYMNRLGEYEVLSIDGERMTIRYDDGSEQTVKVEIQARIWKNIQVERDPSLPKRPKSQVTAGGLNIGPVIDLVAEILRERFSAPYPEDITFRICQTIEDDEGLKARYVNLIEYFSSRGKNGRDIVHNNIGKYTADLTGMVSTGKVRAVDGPLIQSYTVLAYPESE